MKKHVDYNTWLLNNIYIEFGDNIINNKNLYYDEDMLYRESIPDFITGNEIYFNNYKSENYKNFITNKIKHFFSNEFEYNIIPACIIWFRLSKLFSSYSLMIMYNRCLSAIQYFPPKVCYNNYKYIKETPQNLIIVNDDEVYSSCLIDVYESLKLNNFLSIYIKKILGLKNYKLLNSELDMVDSHDLNDPKYDNLKYLVFRTGISQHQLINKSDEIDFSKLIDFTNPPNYKSIKFSLFIAWAISQKILNKDVIKLNYIEDTTLNINKLYNYFIFLINDDSGLLLKLIKWLDDLDWDEYEETTISNGSDTLKLLDSYDVCTLFDSSNNLYKAYYDYPTNKKIKIKDVIENEYIIVDQTQLVESIESTIYDDLDNKTNLDDEYNIDNKVINDKINVTDEKTLLGGVSETDVLNDLNLLNIIGITKLPDGSQIISTVPICKISNIIK